MKILQSRFLRGPNLYAEHSLLVLHLDLAAWPDVAERFAREVAMTPGSPEQTFLARLSRTYQEFIEPTVLNKQPIRWFEAVGTELRAGLPADDGQYALEAFLVALRLAASRETLSAPPDIGSTLFQQPEAQVLRYMGRRSHAMRWNMLGKLLIREVDRRGLPWYPISKAQGLFRVGQGAKGRVLLETATNHCGFIGNQISREKGLSLSVLGACGLPVPRSAIAHKAEDAVRFARQIGYPVVVKPVAGGKGAGVSVHLTTDEAVTTAFEATKGRSDWKGAVVQAFVEGDDHRLLVVGGKFVAAAKRMPPRVTGDGTSTIRALIHAENRAGLRKPTYGPWPETIKIDKETERLVEEQGLSLEAVPEAGRSVYLKRTANMSTGGIAVDVTDTIHPDHIRMAEDAARAIGLDIAGVDFMTADITQPQSAVPGRILEVNATPGLRPHWVGNPERDVVGPFIDRLIPPGETGRIPTVGVTGSFGKTTTVHLIERMFREAGHRTGMCSTHGLSLGGRLFEHGDLSGGGAAAKLLQNPLVEAGIFEIARGGMLKAGMTIDAVDVGIVLAVGDNHIGVDGIRSREDLAKIKSLLVRQTRGTVILNAEDPLVLAMRELSQAERLCLVATRMTDDIHAHIRDGGLVALLEGEGIEARVKIAERAQTKIDLPIGRYPGAQEGRNKPFVVNALFAVAAAYAHDLPVAAIEAALSSYEGSFEDNPGRWNWFTRKGVRVLINWADGEPSIKLWADAVAAEPVQGRRIAVVAPVGNRPDEFLRGVGRGMAGVFDRVICADREDLRGRQKGEAPGLVAEGLKVAGQDGITIAIAELEFDAFAEALQNAEPGDLVSVISYKPFEMKQVLDRILPDTEG